MAPGKTPTDENCQGQKFEAEQNRTGDKCFLQAPHNLVNIHPNIDRSNNKRGVALGKAFNLNVISLTRSTRALFRKDPQLIESALP